MIAHDAPLPPVGETGTLRRIAFIVALFNLAYFAVEIVAATASNRSRYTPTVPISSRMRRSIS